MSDAAGSVVVVGGVADGGNCNAFAIVSTVTISFLSCLFAKINSGASCKSLSCIIFSNSQRASSNLPGSELSRIHMTA